MPSVERVERIGESVIVYDASLVNHPQVAWFEIESWPHAAAPDGRAGRGRTLLIECAGLACVLRHYYRGGWIASISRDRFIWTGEARNRAFAEWRLLAQLRDLALPVPRPIAARYVRHGPTYRADLITERIAGVVPLSLRLTGRAMSAEAWETVGTCIARFHAARVFHADLNAHNLQVDESGRVFLLDFDRGRIMPAAGDWQRRNLERLHRSLRKIGAAGKVAFGPADWAALLGGYAHTIGTIDETRAKSRR